MSLAALIAAYHEADEPGGRLRATLPLAGRTVVERQARLAASAGADPIVVAVERVPADLIAAIDRLRGQGLKVIVARSAAEAAEAVHPDDRLLVMADGLVLAESHIDRLLALDGLALLTVPDRRVDDRFERIDADSRWAGLALLDGALLKHTAEMLRDWDLQSTLLRRAVQSGARQIALRGEPADDQLTLAESREDLAAIETRLAEGAAAQRRDWVSAYLLAPLEAVAARALLARPLNPTGLAAIAGLLTLLAGLAFAGRWYGTGMALVLLSTFAEGVGDRLAGLRLQDPEDAGWFAYLLPLLAAGALLALGSALSRDHGWGCFALAGTIIAFSVAARIESFGARLPGRRCLAEHKGLAWLLLPFAAMGLWGSGLTALALYAGASFFWAQRHVHAPAPPPPAPAQD
ncbi:MAG: hypothetical protein QOJ94_1615 [Sphingomonadales bacterium]|nr:hypothetical protein [Sphingomonadales bacterium]